MMPHPFVLLGLRRESLRCSVEVGEVRRRWVLGLWLGALAVGLWLGMREKPWEGSGARHLAQGRALRFEEVVRMQLWWAGVWVAGGLGALGLSGWWWMGWARVGEIGASRGALGEAAGAGAAWGRRSAWLLAGAMLLGLGLRLPRMDRAMDRDEQDTVRRSMIGYVPQGRPGEPDGKAVVHPWKMTIWECAQANNPFLFSAVARGTVRGWQALVGAEPWRVSLVALRLPSLVAGVLGLGVLGWLGYLAGRPGVGIGAALLGAVHPLHVEFSTQARGYGMVLLFVPLAMGFAWEALRRGRWRDWWGMAVSLLGLLMANPGSLYFAASLGFFVGGWLRWRSWRDGGGWAVVGLSRLGVCVAAVGLGYLPLILPALPQALAFLKTMKGPLDGMWVLMTWAQYGGGFFYPSVAVADPWAEQGRGAVDYLLGGYFREDPVAAVFLVAGVPWLLWVGARWWWGQGGFRPILLGAVGAPLAAYGMHRSAESPFLYYWYLIYWLPGGLLLTAAALVRLGRGAGPWRGAGLGALYLAVFGFMNRPETGRMSWTGASATEAQVYVRGRYEWTTRPDGITYRRLLPGRLEKKAEERLGAASPGGL